MNNHSHDNGPQPVESFAFPELSRSTNNSTQHGQDGGSRLFASVRAKAELDGYREGFERGTREARAQYEDATRAQNESAALTHSASEALRDAVEQLRQADRLSVEEAAAQAVELAYRLAETIVHREIERDQTVLEAVHRSCALLDVREGITVAVAPEQVELVRGALGPDAPVSVVGDPTIAVGGAIASAGQARVDARWETALARVRDKLGLSPLGND